jgi:hypothetical protein
MIGRQESRASAMDYRTLETLRRSHPAWRLLNADHAPLVASFLYQSFIQPNRRTWPRNELASRLEDHLYRLREGLGEGAFPKPAVQYLDEWAADDRAWLRKYDPADNDEPHYDLTPATERAIDWLAGLGQRQFVGTESRLLTVFELLRQLTEGTEVDPEARIAELERRKARIEAEIGRVRPRAGCCPTSAKSRRTSEAWTAPSASASPAGSGARAPCSKRSSASAMQSPSPTRERVFALSGTS